MPALLYAHEYPHIHIHALYVKHTEAILGSGDLAAQESFRKPSGSFQETLRKLVVKNLPSTVM